MSLSESSTTPHSGPTWFDRDRFALPDLGLVPSATFSFSREDPIFVLGNCFAQHIKWKLKDLGYRAGHGGLGPLYDTQSIRQAATWIVRGGFDRRSIIEVGQGRWFNGHVAPNRFWTTRDEAFDAARKIHLDAGTLIRRCSVTLLVLSTTEHVRDRRTGLAFNQVPEEASTIWTLGRARLSSHSHADIVREVRRTIAVIHRAVPRMRFILAVSPIHQSTTRFEPDVVIANMANKSRLRSALAEAHAELQAGERGADYFPAYELCMLRPREAVFDPEGEGAQRGRHVRQEYVRDVVARTLLDWYARD